MFVYEHKYKGHKPLFMKCMIAIFYVILCSLYTCTVHNTKKGIYILFYIHMVFFPKIEDNCYIAFLLSN